MSFPLSLVTLGHIGSIILLILGFGFVIFWHELGHFLAAKWVGIRVEQFAVGFGQALFSWRQGIGFRVGSTQKEYRARAEQHLLGKQSAPSQTDRTEYSDTEIGMAADELGLGETEYRLNWMPLGGYVKMLGQDDLKPDAIAEDPRAFNKKSVGARMVVISAGVIMNVILAAIGFTILFRHGFNVPPAWIGNIIPNSPAQQAGLHVGDRIVYFDGKEQQDFNKITLNMALVKAGRPIKMVIDRPETPDGKSLKRMELTVTPARAAGDGGFLAMGFERPVKLAGIKKEEADPADDPKAMEHELPETRLIGPGDVITAINGSPVQETDFIKLDQALQSSAGNKLSLTIKGADGKIRENQQFQPHFEEPFGGPFNLAGFVPRVMVYTLTSNSPAVGKIMPGDVIESLTDSDPWRNPSREKLMKRLGEDGKSGQSFKMQVLRGEKSETIEDLKASVRIAPGRMGLGVVLILDEQHPVIADVIPSSPAQRAGLREGDTITSLGGQAVKNWHDVHRILQAVSVDPTTKQASAKVTYTRPGQDRPLVADLTLDAQEVASINDVRYAALLPLSEYSISRQTSKIIEAATWSVTETRDFILQFYLTLRRMVDRSISPSNMMGPVGIVSAGATFAFKGPDWLLWFLCMISANLAVVNFLPIPVVDGGQFMFLILEKIKGKPLSTRGMAIAQYAGLAFLALVVIYVTYHDIVRVIG